LDEPLKKTATKTSQNEVFMASLWNSTEKLSTMKTQMQVIAIGCALVTLCLAILLAISNGRLATLRAEQVQRLERQQAHIQQSSADSLEQVINRMHKEFSAVQTQLQAEKTAGESLRNKLAATQKQLAEAKTEFQRQTALPSVSGPQSTPGNTHPAAENGSQPPLPDGAKAVPLPVAPPVDRPLPVEGPLSQDGGGSDSQASLEAAEIPESALPAESSGKP
jgi:hypothetical protein